MCGFEFFLYVSAGFGRLLGSFTFGYAVVLGGLLCLNSTLVCAVSLWGDSFWIFFCLKISANFLMACNFLPLWMKIGMLVLGWR